MLDQRGRCGDRAIVLGADRWQDRERDRGAGVADVNHRML
jgi:hypothetical protein